MQFPCDVKQKWWEFSVNCWGKNICLTCWVPTQSLSLSVKARTKLSPSIACFSELFNYYKFLCVPYLLYDGNPLRGERKQQELIYGHCYCSYNWPIKFMAFLLDWMPGSFRIVCAQRGMKMWCCVPPCKSLLVILWWPGEGFSSAADWCLGLLVLAVSS